MPTSTRTQDPAHKQERRPNGVFVVAPDDIWLVFQYGGVYHRRAQRWARVLPYGSTTDLSSVHGNATQVYAAGYGQLLHRDGLSWSRVGSTGDAFINSVGGGGAEVWAVGEGGAIWRLSDGTPVREQNASQAGLSALWSDGVSAVAVGEVGTVLQRAADGSWAPQSAGTTNSLRSVWGLAGEVFVAGLGSTLRRRSTAGVWSDEMLTLLPYMSDDSFFGIGDQLWHLSSDGTNSRLFTRRGAGPWSAGINLPNLLVFTLWGASPDTIWAFGYFDIYRLVNQQLQPVGRDQTSRRQMTLMEHYLAGAWGRSSSDLWIGGGAGTILHYQAP